MYDELRELFSIFDEHLTEELTAVLLIENFAN